MIIELLLMGLYNNNKNRQLDRLLSGEEPAEPMAPQFTMRPRDRRVQVTFPVRLTCQVVGSPKPDVSWTHNERPIIPDGILHKFFFQFQISFFTAP